MLERYVQWEEDWQYRQRTEVTFPEPTWQLRTVYSSMAIYYYKNIFYILTVRNFGNCINHTPWGHLRPNGVLLCSQPVYPGCKEQCNNWRWGCSETTNQYYSMGRKKGLLGLELSRLSLGSRGYKQRKWWKIKVSLCDSEQSGVLWPNLGCLDWFWTRVPCQRELILDVD